MSDTAEPGDRYAQQGQGNDPQFASLREIFTNAFGAWDADDNPYNDAPINVAQAPGRVNLIGEHTDYNDGLVFPMAIRPRITFAFRERTDGQVHVQSEQFPDDEITFRIDDDGPGEPKWSNYVRGPVLMLRRDGHTLTGMDAYLVNSLPVGAGLSSSAAMEVGTAVAMLHLSGDDMGAEEIARLCKRAENEVVGLPCGIMDMAAVACGRAGHAMLLDCRSLEITHVPLDPQKVAVVICDSKAEHELTGGEYKQRRESCEKAAKHYGVTALRDLTPETLESDRGDLDDETYRRARHVVTEIARVTEFAAALRSGDYEKAGEAMYASHASMRDDYEISIDEIDFLVETAKGLDGVYGSRLTGGGFGGCTVTLCRPDAAYPVCEALAQAYKERFGIDTHPFFTDAMDGARVVD